MSFADFNLKKDFIASIEAAGYQSPTPLQSELIPIVAERKSALVLSQSAAGKTGAFLIPAINYILENPDQEKRGARILILTSRRDRVSQINYTIKRLSRDHNMRFGFIVSGRPYQTQMRLMRRPLDIMIATPGRLNDLMENKKADFSQLEMLIIDDLSSIYNKNLQGLVESILNQVNDSCSSLVFVNNNDEATAFAQSLFSNAINITIDDHESDPANNNSSAPENDKTTKQNTKNIIKEGDMLLQENNNQTSRGQQNPQLVPPENLMPQNVYVADDYTHKIALMDHFLDEFSGEKTLIYTSTNKVAKTLQENLTNHGHAAEIAEELSPDELASGDIDTLIISDQDKNTNVNELPTGYDIHLVHFDLPYKTANFIKRLHNHDNPEEKRDEAAILVVDGRNYSELKQIEKTIGTTLEQAKVPGLEPLLPFVNKSKPTPSNRKPQNRNNNNRNTRSRNSNNRNNASRNNRAKGNKTSQNVRKKPQRASAQNNNGSDNSSNTNNNNKSKRQRKGPFGRLNGGVHRKQSGSRSDTTNTGQQKRGGPKNQKRRPKIGVSSRGTNAPNGDRGWQSDFAEPKERQATPKRVVIRYKDKKRSLLSEKPEDES